MVSFEIISIWKHVIFQGTHIIFDYLFPFGVYFSFGNLHFYFWLKIDVFCLNAHCWLQTRFDHCFFNIVMVYINLDVLTITVNQYHQIDILTKTSWSLNVVSILEKQQNWKRMKVVRSGLGNHSVLVYLVFGTPRHECNMEKMTTLFDNLLPSILPGYPFVFLTNQSQWLYFLFYFFFQFFYHGENGNLRPINDKILKQCSKF